MPFTVNNTPANGVENSFFVNGLSSGIYTWTVNCTDGIGLSTVASPTKRFIVDSQMPNITLHNPLPNQTIQGYDIKFNWTVMDSIR